MTGLGKMPGIDSFWQIMLVCMGPVLSGIKMVFMIPLPDEAPGFAIVAVGVVSSGQV